MLKKKLWFRILIIIFIVLFFNIVYFIATNWQDFFSSSTPQKINLKTYSNSKIGVELKYPSTWILQDNGDNLNINPMSNGNVIYFSAGIRKDLNSLDDVKKTLATNVPITSVQIGGATGFEYTDSDYHNIIWLENSGKIFFFKTYFSPSSDDRTADKILATVNFIN